MVCYSGEAAIIDTLDFFIVMVLVRVRIASHTHLLSKCLRRSPSGRRPRRSLRHHLIYLLQRETLGLWNQEVRIEEATPTETSPNPEHVGPEVAEVRADHVGGDNCDNGVP